MTKFLRTAAIFAATAMAIGTAYAATGDELQGQTVDVVFGDGTQNSIYFGANGQAVVSDATNQSMIANWYVENDQLCLMAGGTQECWAYTSRFAAGQTVTMESGCDAASQWTARGVNPEMAPLRGERG